MFFCPDIVHRFRTQSFACHVRIERLEGCQCSRHTGGVLLSRLVVGNTVDVRHGNVKLRAEAMLHGHWSSHCRISSSCILSFFRYRVIKYVRKPCEAAAPALEVVTFKLSKQTMNPGSTYGLCDTLTSGEDSVAHRRQQAGILHHCRPSRSVRHS